MNRTDEEIVDDIQKKVYELNNLLAEAQSNELEIMLIQNSTRTLGYSTPYIYIEMVAKKVISKSLPIPYTGGLT
jgi:hypothetical protein